MKKRIYRIITWMVILMTAAPLGMAKEPLNLEIRILSVEGEITHEREKQAFFAPLAEGTFLNGEDRLHLKSEKSRMALQITSSVYKPKMEARGPYKGTVKDFLEHIYKKAITRVSVKEGLVTYKELDPFGGLKRELALGASESVTTGEEQTGIGDIGDDPSSVILPPDPPTTSTTVDVVYVANFADDTVSVINTSTDAVDKTITVGDQPSFVTASPDGNIVLVSNQGTETVSRIDTATNTVAATISVNGTTARRSAISPDSTLAVVSDGSASNVTKITFTNNTPVTLVTDEAGIDVAISSDSLTAYVANSASNNVSKINLTTNTKTKEITVDQNPMYIIATPDGSFAYTSNDVAESVTKIDLSDDSTTNISTGAAPAQLAVTPNSQFVYVSDNGAGTVTKFNVSTNAATTITVQSGPSGIAVTPDGRFVYVANTIDNTVSKINVSTDAVTNITVGDQPEEVAITSDSKFVYVTNNQDNTVSKINVETDIVDATITVGSDPEYIAVATVTTSQTLRKWVNKPQATIGDILTYTLSIHNGEGSDMTDLEIRDAPPRGFRLVEGSTFLSTGQPITPVIQGKGVLLFNLPTLDNGEAKVIRYQMIPSVGLRPGKYVNQATAISTLSGRRYGFNRAEAKVVILPDPLFQEGTILGRVFVDENQNGFYDDNEEGLPAAVLFTEEGIRITTDENGLYSLPGVYPKDHVIKISKRSLPKGSMVTTPSKVLVRVTDGLMRKVNFGVYLHKPEEESKND